jgi:hypothetical protein
VVAGSFGILAARLMEIEWTHNGKRYGAQTKRQPDGVIIAADLFRYSPWPGDEGDPEFWPEQKWRWQWLGGWCAASARLKP